MTDISTTSWSEVDASNSQQPPEGWPAGMNANGVEPSARMNMAAVKRFWNRINPTYAAVLATTDSYTVSPSQAITGYGLNERWDIRFPTANTSTSPNILISSLPPQPIRKYSSSGTIVNLGSGDLQSKDHLLYWDGTEFVLTNPNTNIPPPTPAFTGGTLSSTTSMSGAPFNETYTSSAVTAAANIWDISGVAANQVDLTATAQGNITSFGTIQAGAHRRVRFTGAAPGVLTNSASLTLPGAVSITIQQNDEIDIWSVGSGNWLLANYFPYNGPAIYGRAAKGTMQTGTDNGQYVTAARVNDHPGVAKAWIDFSLAGGGATTNASYGCSVARTGVGDYTITFSTAFTTANYGVGMSLDDDGANYNRRLFVKAGGRLAGSIEIVHTDSTGAPSDTGRASFQFFGTQ